MRSIILKELRELILPAAAMVLCAALIAGIEVVYNSLHPQSKVQGLATGVWLVLSIALAFLGGGAAIAREGRQRLIFLTSWPQARIRLWLIKAVISFTLTMLVVAAGCAICLAIARPSVNSATGEFMEAGLFRSLAVILPVCFVFGLMWSGLLNTVLGAGALGFVSMGVCVPGVVWFLEWYLPTRWGPYVGNAPPPPGGIHTGGLLIILAAIPLLAGGWTFARLPVLETRKRVVTAVGLLLGMVLIGSTAHLGWKLAIERPSLRSSIASPGLAGDDKYLYFGTSAGGGKAEGLWIVSIDGGEARLIARGGKSWNYDLQGALALRYGLGPSSSSWAVEFPSLHLRRLRGEPIVNSPDGRYWATGEQAGGIAVRDARGRQVALIANYGEMTFSPDSQKLYYGLQDGRIMVLDLTTGQQSRIANLSGQGIPLTASPDGKRLLVLTGVHAREQRVTIIINLQNGEQRRFPASYSPFTHPFVDRFTWCRQRAPGTTYGISALVTLETESMRVRTTIPASVLKGEPLAPWHQEGVPYVILTSVVRRRPPDPSALTPPRLVWMAKADGSDLRFLRQESRQLLGMAADGAIILWDRQRTFVRWSPVTNEERVIARL